MKQYEAVIETLDKLGGVATLGELNREVFKITDCEWKTKTPFASIRRIVQKTKGIYKISTCHCSSNGFTHVCGWSWGTCCTEDDHGNRCFHFFY